MKFIVIEGTDAAGKATQTKLLADYLRSMGKTVKTFSCPDYENVTGKLIIQALKGEKKLDILTLQMLFAANRYEFVPELFAQCKKDKIDYLIADRYVISSIVYGDAYAETHKSDRPGQFIAVINDRLPQPDLSILLDVSVEESFRRRPERRDSFETDKEFLHNVRLEYLRKFSLDASGKMKIVTATPVHTKPSRSIDEIHQMVIECLREMSIVV